MKRTAAALGLLAAACSALAADWPAWRGPTGQGHSDEKDVPLKWSPKENVKWKVPLAHQGNSTPVVWKDRIFLTQATTPAEPWEATTRLPSVAGEAEQ